MTRWGVHFDKQTKKKSSRIIAWILPEYRPNFARIRSYWQNGGGGGTLPPDPPPPPRLIYLYAVSYVHAVQTTSLLRYPISEFALIPDLLSFSLSPSHSLLEYCNEAFILLSSNFHLTDSKVQTQFRKTQYNSIWEGIGWSYLEENKRWEINVLGLRLFC